VRINGVNQVRAAAENILDSGQAIQQEMLKRTKGGLYELAFSFAENIKEKWMWGLTVGIPILYYNSNSIFTESDTSSNQFNGFKSSIYQDNFKTTGTGVNLKVGAIYRPRDFIRLGFALHSPSFMTLTDTRTVNINTQIESDSGIVTAYNESSLTYTNGSPGQSKYFQNSSWKAIASASYVFREVKDVRKQKGFISVDIEYVNHRSSRFSSNNETPTESERAYYKQLNKVVKQEFKGNVNFRVGGELKFNVIMARLGFAYYGNPYKDAAFKASQSLLSGGLGYRDKGFFIDLTYVHNLKRDINLPYRLEDRANTFANLKNSQGTIVATVGFKF
jgi:long-subunit fatty acid transport protein